MIIEERQNPVIEDISGSYSVFAFIQFCKGHPTIRVDKGLLVNTTDSLDIADIICILRPKVSRVLGLDLANGFAALFFPFHCHQLSFGKDKTLLGYTGL